MKNLLTDIKLDTKIQIRVYDATVINILLWGCESWTLSAEHLRKLEVCHHRFLRKMARITIYDVKELRIKRNEIRSQMGCYNIDQIMELRRMRWLDKLAKMETNRFPRKFLNVWTNNPRITGRPQKTIKHGICKTFKNVNIDTRMNKWIKLAKKIWGDLVE